MLTSEFLNPTVSMKMCSSHSIMITPLSLPSPNSLSIQKSQNLKTPPPSSYHNSATTSSSSHYNALIRTHVESNHPQLALLAFHRMLSSSSSSTSPPDPFAFPLLLKACARLSALREAEQIHCIFLKSSPSSVHKENIHFHTSLINLYFKCGKPDEARKVFDKMPQRNTVTWNSMISGFARSGDMASALSYFDKMPNRNIASWNALLAGYVRADMCHDALKLFLELIEFSGVEPDESTMASLISAISESGLFHLGRRAHAYVVRKGFSLDGPLGVALIAMYTRCGSIDAAHRVFLSVSTKNVSHWSCMIGGLAAHGLAERALRVFSEMVVSGVKPNYVTFIGVLNACAHQGLAEEGLNYFHLMRSFRIEPRIQHYGCLVDLLGRSGRIKEAMELVSSLRTEAGFVAWGTLLSACRKHGNVAVAEAAAKKLVELEPENGSSYALLSNLYAETGRWAEYRRTRRMMEERGVAKVPGFSRIEVGGSVHQFVAGDMFHVNTQEIYHILDDLKCNMMNHE